MIRYFIVGILMCLISTLGLYKTEVINKYHADYPPSSILQLPECIRSQITGRCINVYYYFNYLVFWKKTVIMFSFIGQHCAQMHSIVLPWAHVIAKNWCFLVRGFRKCIPLLCSTFQVIVRHTYVDIVQFRWHSQKRSPIFNSLNCLIQGPSIYVLVSRQTSQNSSGL